jgi:hypothetical protein
MRPEVKRTPQMLEAENRLLRQQLDVFQSALVFRARAHIGEIVDAVTYTVNQARQGDATAKANLEQLLKSLDDGRHLTRITLPGEQNGG